MSDFQLGTPKPGFIPYLHMCPNQPDPCHCFYKIKEDWKVNLERIKKLNIKKKDK